MLVKLMLLALDCHCTVPVLPDRVKIVLFVPEQTVAAPLTVPATDVAFTVMVALVLVAALHTPLVTTAL
jgi:hypothetical protein